MSQVDDLVSARGHLRDQLGRIKDLAHRAPGRSAAVLSIAWLIIAATVGALLLSLGYLSTGPLDLSQLRSASAMLFGPILLAWSAVFTWHWQEQRKHENLSVVSEQRLRNAIALESQLDARRRVEPDLEYDVYEVSPGKNPYRIRAMNHGVACIAALSNCTLPPSREAIGRARATGTQIHTGAVHTFPLSLAQSDLKRAKNRGLLIWVTIRYRESASDGAPSDAYKASRVDILLLTFNNDGWPLLEKLPDRR